MSALVGTMITAVGSPAGAVPLDETLNIPVDSAAGVQSSPLDATKTYLVTVTGTYSYGLGTSQADAECSTLNPDNSWQRNRFLLLEPGGDQLDVYVNGEPVEWEPTTADVLGCNTSDHTYRLAYRPPSNGPATFAVRERSDAYNDNFGSLVVHISEESVLQTVDVPAASQNGVLSTVSLTAGRSYRLEARGTFTYLSTVAPASFADAECVSVGQTAGPSAGAPDVFGAVLTPNDSTDDPLDLYVDGQPRAWTPAVPTAAGCDDSTHTYNFTYKPTVNGPVHLRVNDANAADNTGILRVKIIDLGVIATIVPGQGLPRIDLSETVSVDSSSSLGATSLPLTAGQQYLLEASGTYAYGAGTADAECSDWPGNDSTFRRERFLGYGPNLLDVLLNGTAVDWVPTVPTPEDCNTTDHVFRYEFIPSDNAPISLRVNDNYYGDNSGVLKVKIFRIREIPLGSVLVDATNTGGANSLPLIGGQTYRLAASGTYDYWTGTPGTDADAECTQAAFAPYNDPTYQPSRFMPGDILDLYVGNTNVTWAARTLGAGACDPNHEYDVKWKPTTTGPLNLKVMDTGSYADNQGILTVNLFLQLV